MGKISFLNRTPLTEPIEIFVKDIEKHYPIGAVTEIKEILEGYEDANFKLTTNQGCYFLKIFSKERNNIRDYVHIINEANAIGVPTTKLIKTNDGRDLLQQGNVFCFVADFFHGRNFYQTSPTANDILNTTKAIAQLNTLNFPVLEEYDSWGNKNFLIEYNKNGKKLNLDDQKLFNHVAQELQSLNYTDCKNGIIHGDMQRKHVLKNEKNEYCIIDYGCARNDYLVYELSTHLAWFCFDEENYSQWPSIEKIAIEEYQKIHQLPSQELLLLPPLIKAAYANYLLQSQLLINSGDTSEQTRIWNQKSKALLSLYRRFSNL